MLQKRINQKRSEMNTNINTGTDPHRIQQNKPSFFVNWTDKNGQNQYKFFEIRMMIDTFIKILKLEK